MALVSEDQKETCTYDESVWPLSILLNKEYGINFTFIQCKGIPKTCMNNEDGEILCKKCSNSNMDNITPNKLSQNMINKLKVKCPTLCKGGNTNEVEGGNNVITQAMDNQCDWTGIIKEIDDQIDHINECGYVIIECVICSKHECPRKDMNYRIPQCPDAVIDCPLSCGIYIFLFVFCV